MRKKMTVKSKTETHIGKKQNCISEILIRDYTK